MKIDGMETMKEFALIIRQQHPAWKGDRVLNGGAFLRKIFLDMPEDAKALAFDLECNAKDYSEETGIPEQRIFQASKVLFGLTCEI